MTKHNSERDFRMLEDGMMAAEQRERICAHLAECQSCMHRYVEYLESGQILVPPRGLAEQVLWAQQQRERRRRGVKPNIALRAMLAASLALVLWWGGAFGGLMRLGDGIGYTASQLHGQLTQEYSDFQRSRIDKQMEEYHKQMEQYFDGKGATGNEQE